MPEKIRRTRTSPERFSKSRPFVAAAHCSPRRRSFSFIGPAVAGSRLESVDDIPRGDKVASTFYEELSAAYDEEHPDLKPDEEALQAAADGLAELYHRNIFPEMKVSWDTYPTHIGHMGEHADVRGCFRCHDDEHATEDGEELSQDCELCHVLMAEEESPDDLDDSLKEMLGY